MSLSEPDHNDAYADARPASRLSSRAGPGSRRPRLNSSMLDYDTMDEKYPTQGAGRGSSNIERLFSALRRQKWLLLLGIILGIGLGIAYLHVTVPRFTATASLLVDSQAQAGVDNNANRNQGMIDAVRVDSQLEVMRSDQTMRSVVASFGPSEREAFNIDLRLAGLRSAMPDAGWVSIADRVDLELLRRNLRVSRVERTYVMVVSYTSASPSLAATIANAFVRKYIDNQSKIRTESEIKLTDELTSRASVLVQQIASLEIEALKVSSTSRVLDETLFRKRELGLKVEQARKELDSIRQQERALSQQSNVPFTGARAITDAVEPSTPSQPKVALVLALSIFLGGALGGGLCAARELSDRSFRTGAAVVDELQVPFLGLLPFIKRLNRGKSQTRLRLNGPNGTVEVPPALLLYNDYPLSRYSETLRATRVMLDALGSTGAGKLLGITSVFPTEGKTTLAANLAFALASDGAKVLLIDGDIRRMRLSAALVPPVAQGFVNLVGSDPERALPELVFTNETGSFAFLPAGPRLNASRAATLQVDGVQAFLDEAKRRYQYIIVDLPPIGPVAASKSLLLSIEHFVLVARWGKTPVSAVLRLLETEPRLRSRLLGVVLNKVNLKGLSSYESRDEGRTSSYDAYFEEPGQRWLRLGRR